MDTAHNKNRCPVYLHPACTTSPAAVRKIQQDTGCLVVITSGRTQLKPITSTADFGPFGGDAA
jgi:hypothetical protein